MAWSHENLRCVQRQRASFLPSILLKCVIISWATLYTDVQRHIKQMISFYKNIALWSATQVRYILMRIPLFQRKPKHIISWIQRCWYYSAYGKIIFICNNKNKLPGWWAETPFLTKKHFENVDDWKQWSNLPSLKKRVYMHSIKLKHYLRRESRANKDKVLI